MNKDHLEKWQQYQLSLSDPEVKMQAQAMIMHNNNEDFINSRLTEDAVFFSHKCRAKLKNQAIIISIKPS